jgi:hypothetical protein
MKRCFIAVALLAAVILSAADTALLKYAPEGTGVVLEADITALLKHPEVTAALAKPDYVKTRQEWESKTGIRLQDFQKIMLFVKMSGKGIALLKVDRQFDLKKFFDKNQVKFQEKAAAGKTFFRVLAPVQSGRNIELLPLEPGVIIAGESGDIATYLKGKRGNAGRLAPLVQKVPAGYPVWLVYNNMMADADGKITDPQQVCFAFRFAGKEKKDLNFLLKLFCADENGAQVMAGMVPMYANMGLALAFGNDPALSGELLSLIKPDVQGNTLVTDITVNADLAGKVSAYLQKSAKKFAKKQAGTSRKKSSRSKKASVKAE